MSPKFEDENLPEKLSAETEFFNIDPIDSIDKSSGLNGSGHLTK
jgi:hypothetical protein